MPPSI